MTRGSGRLLAAALVAVLVAAACGGDDVETATGEVIVLEPAGSVGDDPFTDTIDLPDLLDLEAELVQAANDGASGEGGPTYNGTKPGLYGGTRDNGTCDPDQLIDYLESHPAKARAWADVQDIDVDGIADYIDALTPVLLLVDTRVTNHGFVGGRAKPLQSVLQAGTAVLVDDTGVPRARCACGNPLLPPRTTPGADYQGKKWYGFDPAEIATVDAGATTERFTLVDAEDPDYVFERPAGTSGDDDGKRVPLASSDKDPDDGDEVAASGNTDDLGDRDTEVLGDETPNSSAPGDSRSSSTSNRTDSTTTQSDPKPKESTPKDTDGDGDPDATDCEPQNASISHNAEEKFGNPIDEDCDGLSPAMMPDLLDPQTTAPTASGAIRAAGLVPTDPLPDGCWYFAITTTTTEPVRRIQGAPTPPPPIRYRTVNEQNPDAGSVLAYGTPVSFDCTYTRR